MKRLTDILDEPKVPISLFDEDVDLATKKKAIELYSRLSDECIRSFAKALSPYFETHSTIKEDVELLMEVSHNKRVNANDVGNIAKQFQQIDVGLPNVETLIRYSVKGFQWRPEMIISMTEALRNNKYEVDKVFFDYVSFFDLDYIPVYFAKGFDDANAAFKASTRVNCWDDPSILEQQEAFVFFGYTSVKDLNMMKNQFPNGTPVLWRAYSKYLKVLADVGKTDSFSQSIQNYAKQDPEKIDEVGDLLNFLHYSEEKYFEFIEHFDLIHQIYKSAKEDSPVLERSIKYILENSDYDPAKDATKILAEAHKIDPKLRAAIFDKDPAKILAFEGDIRWLSHYSLESDELKLVSAAFNGDYDKYSEIRSSVDSEIVESCIKKGISDIQTFRGLHSSEQALALNYIERLHDRLDAKTMRQFVKNGVSSTYVNEVLDCDFAIRTGQIPMGILIACYKNGFTAGEIANFNETTRANSGKYLDGGTAIFHALDYIRDMQTYFGKAKE